MELSTHWGTLIVSGKSIAEMWLTSCLCLHCLVCHNQMVCNKWCVLNSLWQNCRDVQNDSLENSTGIPEHVSYCKCCRHSSMMILNQVYPGWGGGGDFCYFHSVVVWFPGCTFNLLSELWHLNTTGQERRGTSCKWAERHKHLAKSKV